MDGNEMDRWINTERVDRYRMDGRVGIGCVEWTNT